MIARHIETNDGSILERLRDLVDDIPADAPFAVAMVIPSGVVLARRGNPLFWSRQPNGRCWFASTNSRLPGDLFQIPDERAFMIPFGDEEISEISLRPRTMSRTLFVGSDCFA